MQKLRLSGRYPGLLLDVVLDIQDRGIEGLRSKLDAQRRVTKGFKCDSDASLGTGGDTIRLAHGLGHAGDDVLQTVLEDNFRQQRGGSYRWPRREGLGIFEVIG